MNDNDMISRAAAIAEVMQMVELHRHEIFRGELLHYTGVKAMLEALPAVDAAPVVRCRDCKHYAIYQMKDEYTADRRYKSSVCIRGMYAVPRRPDWYCADGERRDDDGKDA